MAILATEKYGYWILIKDFLLKNNMWLHSGLPATLLQSETSSEVTLLNYHVIVMTLVVKV